MSNLKLGEIIQISVVPTEKFVNIFGLTATNGVMRYDWNTGTWKPFQNEAKIAS